MSIFSIFKKKVEFFSSEDQSRILETIRKAEKRTSGEIRMFIELKNPLVDPLERAALIFSKLKMEETDHRNAVLLYIATKHKELALYGDKGIHEQVGSEYWKNEVKMMLQHFSENHLVDGIVKCITDIGETLTEKFPYIPTEDKNELPDDIVFGN